MIFPRFALEDWFARFKPGCHVNMGSSDIEPVAVSEILESPQTLGGITLGYGGALGSDALRQQVASTYENVEPQHVHAFTGATEAVFCLYAALLGQGDHAVVITPTYQLLVDLPIAVGASVTSVPLNRYAEGWSLSTAAVAAAINEKTRLVVVNSPNNPTGWVADDAQLAELAALAETRGAVLIADEVYRGLGTSTSSAVDLHRTAIAVGSVSKTFGVAGLRVGWIVARDPDVRDRLRTARYWTTLSSSPVTDAMAVQVLRASTTLLKRSEQIITANSGLLRSFVFDRSDIAYTASSAGTTGYVQLLGREAESVARRLAEVHGVFTVPSTALLAPGQYLRVALGRVGLAHGLAALRAVLGAGDLG